MAHSRNSSMAAGQGRRRFSGDSVVHMFFDAAIGQ